MPNYLGLMLTNKQINMAHDWLSMHEIGYWLRFEEILGFKVDYVEYLAPKCSW